MSFDTQSLDALISAIGWLLGVSMFFVGGTFVAFAFWWAQAMVAPSLPKLFVRAVLAWFGICLVTFGTASIGIGTEALLGYPFGPSSGGTVLFGYLLGLRLITLDLATSHALLRQLEERTESGWHDALAWLTAGAGALAWAVTAVLAFVCFVVSVNMALAV